MQQSLVLALVACSVINSGSSVPVLNNTSANIGIFANDLRSVIREELANGGLGESKDANVNINVDAGEIFRLKYLGQEWKYAAWSCKEIADKKPNYTSGYYWVSPREDDAYLLYCDLEREFSIGTRGWHRVANWNMTDPNHQCPNGFRLIKQNGLRLCGKMTDGPSCNSVTFHTRGLMYRHVCGRVQAYQHQSPDGFYRYDCPSPCGIDSAYVDGVSITHGHNPRKHVWTFSTGPHGTATDFVESNYFCESADNGRRWVGMLFTDDPLWDGQNCGSNEAACCQRLGPWFCTELPEPTTHSLEVRLCTDQSLLDEDVPIELVELYVQ